MSTVTRRSAATASVVIISASLGFGMGASMLPAKDYSAVEISKGPRVISPNGSRENLETRSRAGIRIATQKMRSLSFAGMPQANVLGPKPGSSHANLGLGRSRSIAPACVVAMN